MTNAKPKTVEFTAFDPAPLPDEDEVAVGLPALGRSNPSRAFFAAKTAIDLSERPKAWFLIGRGKTGKTTLIRWMAERMAEAGRGAVLADMDRTNATLSSYTPDVQRPPEGDEAASARWLERLLAFVMEQKTSALIDLGGGDTTLRRLIAEMPDLGSMLQEAGVAPVAAYLLGPQPDDLSPLATLEQAGFRPTATALVLNEGLAEIGGDREEVFARILRHSAFNGAVKRGAVPVWMPRLIPAGEIEARRVHFAQARDGVARDDRRQAPLGPFDRSRVRAWLSNMDTELAGIASWMP
jgi:hypothetical protein